MGLSVPDRLYSTRFLSIKYLVSVALLQRKNNLIVFAIQPSNCVFLVQWVSRCFLFRSLWDATVVCHGVDMVHVVNRVRTVRAGTVRTGPVRPTWR